MTQAERLLAKDALTAGLTSSALEPADVVAGSPDVRMTELTVVHGVEIGIWEITPGTVTDIEVDEVFVVLSGRGDVRFRDGSVLPIATGSVVRLRAGDRTTWHIEETVRKIYVLPPVPHPQPSTEDNQQ